MSEQLPIYLDLGCGENKTTKEGFFNHGLISSENKDKEIKIIGVDLNITPQVDMIHDLTTFPYPFEDDSITGIITSHFVEHLDGLQRIVFFDEMYRILKVGGKMRHIHPYYKSPRAYQDPTHKWPPICEESYLYWQKEWREVNKLSHYLGKCDFEVNIIYNLASGEWVQRADESRNFAMVHYWNVIADMVVDMKKKPIITK